jgi:hypothetical protein
MLDRVAEVTEERRRTHRAARMGARQLMTWLVLASACVSAVEAQATQPTPTRRKPGPTTARPRTTTPATKAVPKVAPAPAPAPKTEVPPASAAPAPAPVNEPTAVVSSVQTSADVRPSSRTTAASRETPWYAHPKRSWFTLGLATANGGLGCAICRPNQTRAVAANAAAGWTVRPRLILGLQGQTWLDVFGDGFDQTMLHGQAVARWYPFARQPLSVTGGVGGLAYRVDDGAFVLRAQTLAAQVTIGWELPARNGMTVTPFVAMLTTAPARLRGANGFSLADDARFGLVQGGVALSWF